MAATTRCKECDAIFTPVGQQVFCSRSCAAKTNGRLFPKRKKKIKLCACGLSVTKTNKWCDACILKGAHLHTKGLSDIKSETRRRIYLLRTRENVCSVCLNSEWLGNPIPLEVDHIDGCYTNNDESNLRLICPNCHATMPTYKGRNRGRGRLHRRKSNMD